MVLEIRKSLTLETPQLGRRGVGRMGVRIACGFVITPSVSSTSTEIDPCLLE